MASKFFKTHIPDFAPVAILAHQKELIEENYNFLTCKLKGKILICKGLIVSEDYINKYMVELRCVAGYEPHSKILEPSNIKPSLKIHMYEDHSLCLHYPPDMKWTGWVPIYKYTIPWLREWVHYYEIFLVNGGHWEGRESPVHFTENDKNIMNPIISD